MRKGGPTFLFPCQCRRNGIERNSSTTTQITHTPWTTIRRTKIARSRWCVGLRNRRSSSSTTTTGRREIVNRLLRRRHHVSKSPHLHFPCLHCSLQISSDGQRFIVSRKVADLSVTVQESIGDIDDDDDSVADGPIEVTMPNVTSEVLSLVVQYLEHYMIEEMTAITVRACSTLRINQHGGQQQHPTALDQSTPSHNDSPAALSLVSDPPGFQ
jgi:hypothetical protein